MNARATWMAFGGLLGVATIGWGSYNVVSLLGHDEHTTTATFSADGLRSIDISNDVGSVTVTAGDVTEILVTAQISDGLRPTGNRMEVDGDRLELAGTCPSLGTMWCSVDYDIVVPADLDLMASVDNGSLEVVGLTGSVEARTDNGRVAATNLSGSLVLSSDNGSVRATGLTSQTVTADSDNGDVRIEFSVAPQSVALTGDNGDITLVVPRDDAAYAVEISTDNGSSRNDLATEPSSPRSVVIRTDNGDATARYP